MTIQKLANPIQRTRFNGFLKNLRKVLPFEIKPPSSTLRHIEWILSIQSRSDCLLTINKCSMFIKHVCFFFFILRCWFSSSIRQYFRFHFSFNSNHKWYASIEVLNNIKSNIVFTMQSNRRRLKFQLSRQSIGVWFICVTKHICLVFYLQSVGSIDNFHYLFGLQIAIVSKI